MWLMNPLYIKLGLYNCGHVNVDKEQTKFVSLLSCIAPAFRDKSAFAKKERGKKIATVRPRDFVPIHLCPIHAVVKI